MRNAGPGAVVTHEAATCRVSVELQVSKNSRCSVFPFTQTPNLKNERSEVNTWQTRTVFPCFSFTRPRCSERSFLISSLFKLGKCYFRSHSKPCYLQLLIFSRNQIEGVNARARWSPVFVSTQQVRWIVEGEGRREVKVQQKQRYKIARADNPTCS